VAAAMVVLSWLLAHSPDIAWQADSLVLMQQQQVRIETFRNSPRDMRFLVEYWSRNSIEDVHAVVE
jgi:hypothetical protein